MFILLHQQEILRSSTLIGDITDEKIRFILTSSFNPFNQVSYLTKYLPTIKFGEASLTPEFTQDRPKEAGFPIYNSIFMIGMALF